MELQNIEKPDPEKPDAPSGVRGFLLFFCIVMVFITPLYGIYKLYQHGLEAAPLALNLTSIIFFVDELFLPAVFVCIGILLWMKKRAGLISVRIYYFFTLAWRGFFFAQKVALYIIYHNSTEEMMIYNVAGFIVGTAITVLILLYFFKSKRVKNTYPKKIPEPTA